MFLLNCPKQDRKHDDSLAKHGIEHEDSFPLLTVVFRCFPLVSQGHPLPQLLGFGRPSMLRPAA